MHTQLITHYSRIINPSDILSKEAGFSMDSQSHTSQWWHVHTQLSAFHCLCLLMFMMGWTETQTQRQVLY